VNVGAWLLWGFVATTALTVVTSTASGVGLTRMNLPFMVGTAFTSRRDRAKAIGYGIHVVNGWLFALLYVAGFEAMGRATWWLGAAGGLLHAGAVLSAGMQVIPLLHPRMADDRYGPTVVRMLEPPGFMALHYGFPTPIVSVLSHVVFGAVLGAFYVV
jgi:hypothetical protein